MFDALRSAPRPAPNRAPAPRQRPHGLVKPWIRQLSQQQLEAELSRRGEAVWSKNTPKLELQRRFQALLDLNLPGGLAGVFQCQRCCTQFCVVRDVAILCSVCINQMFRVVEGADGSACCGAGARWHELDMQREVSQVHGPHHRHLHACR